MRFYFLAVPAFAAILLGCNPKTYEDCILEAMKGVDSNSAAIEIKKACRGKFPDASQPKTGTVALTDAQVKLLALRKIEVREQHDLIAQESGVSGKIYNGNSDIAIRKITINLYADDKPYGPVTYQDDAYIAPNSEGYFSIDIENPSPSYSAKIIAAKGLAE